MTPKPDNLDAQRRVIAVKTVELRPDDRYGAPTPGFTWAPLDFDKARGEGLFLLRFAPGARSVPHEHTHGESFLVLEGELHDSDGKIFRAGDFVRYAPGSEHWSVAPEGCLIAVFLRGYNRRLATGESKS
ncbi:MAG: cupin domain-containing protein [Pseudomonadota bacterium]